MKFDDITHKIIGCAMKVHSTLGNGFQEVIYQRALKIEMEKQGLGFKREMEMPIYYDGIDIGTRRVDFFVEDAIMVELKAIIKLEDVHLSQAMNYLEAYKMEIGLLINFGSKALEYKHLFNNKYVPDLQAEDIKPDMVGEPSDDVWELRNYIPDWVIFKMQHDKIKKK